MLGQVKDMLGWTRRADKDEVHSPKSVGSMGCFRPEGNPDTFS